MTKPEELPDPRELTERYYREVAEEWSGDHEMRTHGKLRAVGFDPHLYPGQNIETALLRKTDEITTAEEAQDLLSSLAQSEEIAEKYATAFSSHVDTITEAREKGGVSVVLSSHMFLWDLYFMAVGAGVAEARETGRPIHDVMSANWLIANKLMAFEGHRTADGQAKTLPETITKCANMIFTSPQTESSLNYGVPEDIEGFINKAAAKVLRELLRSPDGQLLFLAPGGSAASQNTAKELVIPTISSGTGKFVQLAKTVFLACATPQGNIRLEEYVRHPDKKQQPTDAMHKLAELTTRVAGVKTIYKEQ